jgi:cell division protein FtsB
VEALVLLALLACPVGMGAMMWWMGRSMKQQQQPALVPADNVDDLRAEQARLTAEIDQLQSERAARSRS